jgi:hypothetical protein
MVEIVKVSGKLLNKEVKRIVRQNVSNLKGLIKRTVPGIGTVFYIKNNRKETVGHIYKDMGEVVISFKKEFLNA